MKDIICMLSWYFFNKFSVGANNCLDMDSEPGAGTYDHVPVLSGVYLCDGGHHAGLDFIGMSIGILNSP